MKSGPGMFHLLFYGISRCSLIACPRLGRMSLHVPHAGSHWGALVNIISVYWFPIGTSNCAHPMFRLILFGIASRITLIQMKHTCSQSVQLEWIMWIRLSGILNITNTHWQPSKRQEINNCITFLPLWPSDSIWHHRTWSTLVQVMTCCLTAPSHYMNQCWLIISEAL